MSFIIAVHVKEGMVLAGDSRTTYTQTAKSGDVTTIKIGTHTTDTTNKVFLCPNNIGIATCGDASLDGVPITGYIESFIREHINQDTDQLFPYNSESARHKLSCRRVSARKRHPFSANLLVKCKRREHLAN